MIVHSDGSIIGTIGGGSVEQYIIEQAREAICNRCSRTVHRSLLTDGKNAVECGGNMTVFIEVVNIRPKLVLIGGGHVNLAIAKTAKFLDFEIQVVENRREFISKERFPMASECHYDDNLAKAIKKVNIDRDTYISIATNHNDTTSIREVINSPAAYIGMLGSKSKATAIMKTLMAEGFSRRNISIVHSPVGLDIGAETPEEIAISVLAEILMVKNKKKGLPLKAL